MTRIIRTKFGLLTSRPPTAFPLTVTTCNTNMFIIFQDKLDDLQDGWSPRLRVTKSRYLLAKTRLSFALNSDKFSIAYF